MSIRTNLNAIKEQNGITNHVILRHGLDINKAKDKIENLNYFNTYFSFEKVDGKLYVDRFKIEMCENPKLFTRNYHDSGNLHTEVDGNIIVSIENNTKVVFNEGLKKGSDTIQLEEEDATQIAEEFQEVGYLFKKLDIEGMISHDTSFFREFYGQEAFKGYVNKVLDAYYQIEYTDEIKKDEVVFVVNKKAEDEVFQKQLKAAEEIYQEKFKLFRHHEIKTELATNIKDTDKVDALRLELYKSTIENRYNHINQQWGNYMDLSLSNDPESCKKYIDNFVTQSAEIINNVSMRSVEGESVELSEIEKEVLQDNAIKIEYLTAYLKVHPDSKENQIPNVEFTKEFFNKVKDPDEMLVEEGKALFGVKEINGKKFSEFVNFGGSFEKIDLEINKLREEQTKNKTEVKDCLIKYIAEKNTENKYKEEIKKTLDDMSTIIDDKESLVALTSLFNAENKDKQEIEKTLNKLTNSAKDENKQMIKDSSDKLINLVDNENNNKRNIDDTLNHLLNLSNIENDKKLEFLERYKEACSFKPNAEELRRGSLILQENAEYILKDPIKCFDRYEDLVRNKEDAERKIEIYNENKDKAKDDKSRNPEIDNIKIQNEVDRFDIANKQLVFLKDYMTKQSMGAEKYEQFMKETDVSDVKIKKQTPIEKLVSEYKQKLERDFGFVDKVELENRRFGLHKMNQMTEEKMKKEIPVYEVNDIVNNINAKQFEKDDLLSLNKRIIKDFSSEQVVANSCEFSRNLQHIVEKGTLSQNDVDLVVANTSAINQWQYVGAQFDADKFITVKYKKDTLREMGETVRNICKDMSENGKVITYEKIKDIDSLNHFVDDYKADLDKYKNLYDFSKNMEKSSDSGDPLEEFKYAFEYAAASYEDAQKSMEDYIKLQTMASKLDEHTYDVFVKENLPEATTVKQLSDKDNQTALLQGIEEFKQEKVKQAMVANNRINELVNPDNGESLKQHFINLNELANNLNESYKVYKYIETKEADNSLSDIEKNYKDKYKEQYYNAVEEYSNKSIAVSDYIQALESNLEEFDRTKNEVENEFKAIGEARKICLQEHYINGKGILVDNDDKLSKQLSEINPENICNDISEYLDINKTEDGFKIDLKMEVDIEVSNEECNEVLKEIEEERLNSKDKEDDYELDL